MDNVKDKYASTCPDADTIQAFISGELNATEHIALAYHLTQCDFCKDAVDGLQLFDENNLLQTNTSLHNAINLKLKESTPNKKNENVFLKVAAAAAILLVTSFTLLYLIKPYQKEENKTIAQNKNTSAAQLNDLDKKSNSDFAAEAKMQESENDQLESNRIKSSLHLAATDSILTAPTINQENKYKNETSQPNNNAKAQVESVEREINQIKETATSADQQVTIAKDQPASVELYSSDKKLNDVTPATGINRELSNETSTVTLSKVDVKNKSTGKTSINITPAEAKARWKRANKYLLQNDTTACVKELQFLILNNTSYKMQADSLIKHLSK